MKLLRETIRKLLLENKESPWARSAKAAESVENVFTLKDWWETGPWGHERIIYEYVWKPDPQDPDCIVRLRIDGRYGSLFLDEIETTPQCEGKGYARQAIDKLKQVAKKHDVPIMLKAKAFNTNRGEGRMSSTELEGWYRSQGFEKKDWAMEWTP